MSWAEKTIKAIMSELAEENYFACQALYKITRVEFSNSIPTLAVSLSSKPVLYINREFIDKNAESENDIKAMLMHEFLHVILRHTEKYKENNPLLNIALDAIINSIIHRVAGLDYSGLFMRLYKFEGIESLMRPYEGGVKSREYQSHPWHQIHLSIYGGSYAADDLYELLKHLQLKEPNVVGVSFIGNHGDLSKEISEENEELLSGIMKKMKGTDIWNRPGERGFNHLLRNQVGERINKEITEWKKDTFSIIKKCLQDDPQKKQAVEMQTLLPFLSNKDRRAFSMLRKSQLLPFSEFTFEQKRNKQGVNIYLDVSGSMDKEIRQLITLLYFFRDNIRFPIWTFSNEVSKAVFRNGSLIYDTTSGTSISCVFEHIRKKGFRKNLILTDGYIETITPEMLHGIEKENLWVLLSAHGSGNQLNKNNLKYHQLKPL